MEKEAGNTKDLVNWLDENMENIIRDRIEHLSRAHKDSMPPAPSISFNELSAPATNSDENHGALSSDICAAGPSDPVHHEVSGELSDECATRKVPAKTLSDHLKQFLGFLTGGKES
jgi:hypothetical protein